MSYREEDQPRFQGSDDDVFVQIECVVYDQSAGEAMAARLYGIAAAIHYPACWDTMAYPTLLDAITEIGCNPATCCTPSP